MCVYILNSLENTGYLSDQAMVAAQGRNCTFKKNIFMQLYIDA